jgi:hypothetical protein
MGKIKKIVKTRFVDEEEGFEYYHEPVEDSVTIKKTPEGYEARYLVQDSDPMPPDDCDDDNLFLVNYHRDFDVRRDKIITKDDLVNWYRKTFDDYKEDPEDENEIGKFPLEEKYHIFPLSCLVHSGVWLSLRHSFDCDSQGWDTSHVGAVLVSIEEWPDAGKAIEAAESLIEQWNQYLSGDVYGIVKETYDKEKTPIDENSCWGFYGHKYALEELKTNI